MQPVLGRKREERPAASPGPSTRHAVALGHFASNSARRCTTPPRPDVRGEGGYVHAFHVENFAALDQGSPLARALGAPAALEVMAKLAGVVTRSEQWPVRYLPDVSFRPEPEAEDRP